MKQEAYHRNRYGTSLRQSSRKGGQATSALSSKSSLTTGLSPILLLVLALIHLFYQLYLYLARLADFFRRVNADLSHRSSPAQTIDPTRTPNHLAVILAPSTPSTFRLFLNTFFDRNAQKGSESTQLSDRWEALRELRHQAFNQKIILDVTSIIRLCAKHGITQLTVYTEEQLSPDVVQAISHHFPAPISESADHNAALSASTTPVRPFQRDFVDMVSPDGPGSASASSDDELCKSEDETLPSSNASLLGDEHEELPSVRLHLATSGMERLAQRLEHQKRSSQDKAAATEPTPSASKVEIRVNLVHRKDGKLQVAQAASHIAKNLASRLVRQLRPGVTAVSLPDQDQDATSESSLEESSIATNQGDSMLQTTDASALRKELALGVNVPFFDAELLGKP